MPCKVESLPAELHQYIGTFLQRETRHASLWGGLALLPAIQRQRTPPLLPDLASINAYARTCRVLYNSLNWTLYDACRRHQIFTRRALRHAIDRDQPDLLCKLAAAGVPLDVSFTVGLGAMQTLHVAAEDGTARVVQQLLALFTEEGKNVEAMAAKVYAQRDADGRTPLDFAARRGNFEIVKLLADVMPPDHPSDGETRRGYLGCALQEAASRPKSTMDVLKLLIYDYGGDVNYLATDGKTALYSAIWAGNMPSARLLLEAGANPNVHNNRRIPLHAAAAYSADTDALVMLLNAGANIDAQDYFGQSALHHAISQLHDSDADKTEIRMDTISELLARGADVNLTNNSQETPLHWACRLPVATMGPLVELLLRNGAGASVEKMSNDGRTPVGDVLQRRTISHVGVVKELMKYVEDVQHKVSIQAWLRWQ
ncbi:ANK-REP-REGION domain-containing protein [Mycena chlorophos]|uniref:ANK-REP-REGION domain-containing protein n=1 Tax=Mycena chlorophos TaxID=658473 RepID=A0A8H6S2L7_MYCCL|nr:ANK-REP-REGION domain-containing protein [Mycena chlorophos]